MVTVQVSDSDWSLVLKYWQDLQKHLNQPDDLKKIDFLDRSIFKSAGLNTAQSQSSAGVTDVKDKANMSSISISTMSEIMKEIDNELSQRENKVDDLKTFDEEMKIDSKIKRFIVEPV